MTSSIEDKELILDPPKFRHPDTPAWYSGILTEDDFDVVDPYRSNFLKQLRELVSRKQRILKDRSLTQDQKNIRLQRLALHGQKYEGCRIEDLG
jgi:E3 ubiquitin-protein ligase HECTD1